MKSSRKPIFEHKDHPLLPWDQFVNRQLLFIFWATILIAISLGIGMVGYHCIGELDWIPSFYNAAMILAGMGEIDEARTDAARIFGGSYALFSGVVFVTTIAVMFAPLGHRLLHLMHLDEDDQEPRKTP